MEKFIRKNLSLEKRLKEIKIDHSTLRAPSLTFRAREKSPERIQKEYSQRLEYNKVLKKLDITPNPYRLRNPFAKKMPTFLNLPKIETIKASENEFDQLIDAWFYSKKNELSLINPDIKPVPDYFSLDLEIRNLTKIQTTFPSIPTEEEEEIIKSPLEIFWLKEISSNLYARWDIFEEAFISTFILIIDSSIGIIRKINWKWLLKKLYLKLTCKANDIELFPGHPGLPSIFYNGPIVTFKAFQTYIESGKIKRLLNKSINFSTYYLIEKFKKNDYHYACGSIYKGLWKNFKRDGLGKLTLCDNSFYDGYFFKGLRHGYGTFTGMECSYTGYWVKDVLDGSGELLYYDKSRIEGIWKNGIIGSGRLLWIGGEYNGFMNKFGFAGHGTLITKAGDIKKGIWANSKLEGQGEVILKNGTKYIGAFVQDIFEGNGSIETSDYIYQGQIKQFKPNGNGKIVYNKNNAQYEGEFFNGEINGKGIYKNDLLSLKGNFIQGKLSGNGEKCIENLLNFKGDFYDGMMHGKGILIISHNECQCSYKGCLRLNKFHGIGKLTLGDIIIKGEWAKGENHGNCRFYCKLFKFNGNILNGIIKGKGSIFFEDKCSYEGLWEDGLPNGKGEASDNFGYKITSYFCNSLPIMKNRLSQQYISNFYILEEKINQLTKTLNWLNMNIFQKNWFFPAIPLIYYLFFLYFIVLFY